MRAIPTIKITKPDNKGAFTMTAPDATNGENLCSAIAIMGVACIEIIHDSNYGGGQGQLYFEANFEDGPPLIQFAPTPAYGGNAHESACSALEWAIELYSQRWNAVPLVASLHSATAKTAAAEPERRAL